MRGESPGRRGRRAQNHASPRRDADRGTTQDSRRRRRLRRRRVRTPSGAQARSGRGPDHSRHAVLLPAVSATAPPGGLRGADTPVRGGVAAPQPPSPDEDRAGRGDRRGHAGEGLRDPEDHGRDRERAVRLHRAGGGQRHPDLRHPRAAGQRPGDEDAGRGRLRPGPRHRPAGSGGRQSRRGRAGLPAPVRGGRRRLRGHRDGRLSPAPDHERGPALSAAGRAADQVASDRHRAQADAGAGRQAGAGRPGGAPQAEHRGVARGLDRRGGAGAGHVHRRPGAALPDPDLDRRSGRQPADRHARRGDRTRPASRSPRS